MVDIKNGKQQSDKVYVVPAEDKPVKIVYDNDSCDNKLEIDELTGELFVKRPLSPSERESLLRLINDGVIVATNFGTYTFQTDGTTLSIKGD